jgi:hypothetical protein
MARVITLLISGAGAGTDAPTVDDVLAQVRDHFDILDAIEEAVAESGGNAIDWRMVGASMDSPLALRVAAFPKDYAVNIDQRAELTVRHTAAGLNSLQAGAERPPYFQA